MQYIFVFYMENNYRNTDLYNLSNLSMIISLLSLFMIVFVILSSYISKFILFKKDKLNVQYQLIYQSMEDGVLCNLNNVNT